MATANLKLYDFLRREFHLSEEKASEFAQVIKEVVNEEADFKNENTTKIIHSDISSLKDYLNDKFPTKEFVKDEIHRLELKLEQTKTELTKAIFWTSLIQFLAIVGSVVGILSFVLHK